MFKPQHTDSALKKQNAELTARLKLADRLWHEQVFHWLRTGKAREPEREEWLGKIRPRD